MSKVLSAVLSASLLSIASPLVAQSPSVEIKAWAQHVGGAVVYRYELKNLSNNRVNRVILGQFVNLPDGRAELSVQPSVSSSDDGSRWLPLDVATSPAGWGVAMTFPEESTTFSLEWIDADLNARLWPMAPRTSNTPVSTGADATIAPGATSSAFSVKVPKPDHAYVTGNATVGFTVGSANIPLIRGDTIPPSLRLSVSRDDQTGIFPPPLVTGSWTTFIVTAALGDNYDPAPTVDLSVLSNGNQIEPSAVNISRQGLKWRVMLRNAPGHTFELRFVAEDASGNRATESITHLNP